MELRPIRADEVDDFVRTGFAAFGRHPSRSVLEALRSTIEVERAVVAVDGDRLVATGATTSLELTVPGGRRLPTGGLTWIGVTPTHRRRGILRRLIDRHLDDAVARGEPAVALFASEASIYGRFGYGPATFTTSYEIDASREALAVPVDDEGGVELVGRDRALEVVPALHDRIRAGRPGEVDRTEAAWRGWLAEVDADASEERGVFHVLHRDGDGEPDGYAVYRVGEDTWTGGVPRMRLDVARLDAVRPAADHALWSYLLGLDLFETVRVARRPVDDPVRWRLGDPRRLRVRALTDGLWLRLLDVPTMLGTRRYSTSGTVVVEVEDRLRPDLGGRFRLEVDTHDASCERTDDDPGVTMDAAALGSTYLGGVAVSALAAADRVREHRSGAAALLDRLLRTGTPTPFCGTDF